MTPGSKPCMTKAQKAAWDAGFAAHDAGESGWEACPYRPGLPSSDIKLALAWCAGFDTARSNPPPPPKGAA